MIDYKSFTLENGLRVIVHEAPDTQVAVLNICYDIGSRDETHDKTGFAHLFEHFMFGGSLNIPNYDEALQNAGGENNAFTSADITNYYLTLPAQNLETAFWLESDRMFGLPFDPKVLEVQRKVVIEEFKQRYLNQPYGDVWLKLLPMAYKKHPYHWATIGKEISHIENATMEDVKAFYNKHYVPNRAVMVVAGNVKYDHVKALSEKWFEPIPKGEDYQRKLPKEPIQVEKRFVEVEADVPADMLFMAFHMPGKLDKDYYTADLLSDILGRDKSSLLYQTLVKEQAIFNTLGAYVTGSADPGLLVINGRLAEGHTLAEGEQKVREILNQVMKEGVNEKTLEKVKNQAESSVVFGQVEVLNRAMNLAISTILGDTELVNKEAELIQQVHVKGIKAIAQEILQETNANVMYYKAKKQ